MSSDRDVTRIVRSWLEEGATALPDRVLDAVLDQIPATSQRRPLWPTRRFQEMNNALKLAIAAAAVVVVAVVGVNLLPRQGGIGGPGPSQTPRPSPSPTASPAPTASPTPGGSFVVLPDGPLSAGTYTVAPFWHGETSGSTIRFTYTVPDGWAGIAGSDVVLASGGNHLPGGAGLGGNLGGALYSDPCLTAQNDRGPDIPIGPTVDDFATALVEHPTLDVTTPVNVTLAGYSGKYMDLQVPTDIAACTNSYLPWEPNIYAQDPGHQWHLWILDVAGARVVVQSTDYAGTSPTRRAELQAMVDTIRIER